jgi:2-haloacid dehalogenase
MSEKQPITGIKACVFDAYGTLFDVHSAVGKHRHRLGDIADQVSNLWRTKQLEYQDALDFAFDMHNLEDPELQSDLIEAYFHLDCYPEVPQALSMLKARGFRIAILSNGTPAMLEAAVRNSGLEELIEKNFSVEEVGVFKPDPRVYQIAVDGLNVTPDEIVFQSSNAWDVSGAATFGLRVCR